MKTIYRNINKKLMITILFLLGITSLSVAGRFTETLADIPSEKFALETKIADYTNFQKSIFSLDGNTTTSTGDPVLRALDPNDDNDSELGDVPVFDGYIFLAILAVAYAIVYRNKNIIIPFVKTISKKVYTHTGSIIVKFLNPYQNT